MSTERPSALTLRELVQTARRKPYERPRIAWRFLVAMAPCLSCHIRREVFDECCTSCSQCRNRALHVAERYFRAVNGGATPKWKVVETRG